MTAEPFWRTEVFWVAVSAVATVCYLLASVLLWLTTRANTRATLKLIELNKELTSATVKQADVAIEQFKLNKELVEATVKQSQVATEQLKLSQQIFTEARRPLLWFRHALVRAIREEVPEGGLLCEFVLLNGGSVPATELQWKLSLSTNRGPIQGFQAGSEFPTDVLPGAEWPQSVMIDDRFFLTNMRTFEYAEVLIEVFYKSSVDSKDHKVWCGIRYQPKSNRSVLAFGHMY